MRLLAASYVLSPALLSHSFSTDATVRQGGALVVGWMEKQVPTTSPADAEILTDLAHKLVDQVALYGLAASLAQDEKVRTVIRSAKTARGQLLQDINAKMWLSEISPIDQGTKLGTAGKAFDRLRASGHTDQSVIAEVERGEDYLLNRISMAREDDRLTAHTRNYLGTVVSRIETTQAEIAGVRQSLN